MHGIFDHRRYLIPFRSALLPQIFTEVLVVGAGVAGARAAAAASEAGVDVIVLSKGKLGESNTAWAQGGIAAVLDATDSIDSHVADTMEAGAGLCDEKVVRKVVEEGKAAVDDLVDMGMRFDRDANEGLLLGREGGHRANRIVHTDGDATGKALAMTMGRELLTAESVRVFEACFVIDLITESGPGSRVVGAITHHEKYGLQMIWAKAVILATGGSGMLYRETTNPPIATGDGHAMAYRAGARLTDMEFMQFHPTTLYLAGASRVLLTEAIRGEGAYLVNRAGERFMLDEHELGELAPRDIVARAIVREISKGSGTHVYLDCRHLGGERFAERFPGVTRVLKQFDLDPAEDLIPIRPAAHYMIGGLVVDEATRTTVKGLYACGEAAASGLHGANRLASNSLLEGLVLGEVAGRTCLEMMDEKVGFPLQIVSDIRESKRSMLDVGDVVSSFRSVMWRHVSIEREGGHLREVVEMFDFWARYTLDKIFDDRVGWEAQNQLLIGALMTQAAGWREESRGTHYRVDHPNVEAAFCARAHWELGREEPIVVKLKGDKVGADN